MYILELDLMKCWIDLLDLIVFIRVVVEFKDLVMELWIKMC